jgi:hypothetical protein
MTTSDISKKVLEQIRKEAIRPEAQWRFLLRRSLLWIGIALAAGIGAWSLSMLLFPLLSLGLDLPRGDWPHFFLPLLLRPVPLIWLVFAAVFITVATFEFRRIGRGYRHRVAVIALGILTLVIILSGVFHTLRINEASERGFRRNLPPYGASSPAPEDFWFRADNGFLMGTVLSEKTDGFLLTDPDGETWSIVVTPRTDIRPRTNLGIDEDVKIVGDQIDEDLFEADEILPGAPPVFRDRGPGPGPGSRDGKAPPRPDIDRDRIRMR